MLPGYIEYSKFQFRCCRNKKRIHRISSPPISPISIRRFSPPLFSSHPLAWGGPLWTPKNWIFERFYIIKSNWKSSSLFLVFISSCLLLPDPSLGQMKKCTTSLYSWPYWWSYWVCVFLHLTSYNNILCISRPMALTKCTSIKHMWRLRTFI